MAAWLEHLRHPLADQLGRYALTGALVGGVYVLGTLLLSDLVGMPIQVAVLLAYVAAVSLHFVLQRHFVFRKGDRFTLGVGAQIRSYVVIGVFQYGATAAATTWLPGALDVSKQLVYLACVPVLSVCTFFALRTRVFH